MDVLTSIIFFYQEMQQSTLCHVFHYMQNKTLYPMKFIAVSQLFFFLVTTKNLQVQVEGY